MENRAMYVSDGCYSLYRLSENEKSEYMNLLKETNTIPGFYDNQNNCSIMWQLALEDNNWEFSIFDKDENYCGNIMLKYPDTRHPEIGIDIVGRFRNKGIGPRIIKMLARKAYEEMEVEYYIIRVSSKNFHSRHVIEKLGAVPDNSEDIFIKRVVSALEEVLKENNEKIIEDVKRLLMETDEEIYQYRYLPEMFRD